MYRNNKSIYIIKIFGQVRVKFAHEGPPFPLLPFKYQFYLFLYIFFISETELYNM